MDNFKGTSGSFLNNKILLRYSYFIRNNNKKYAFSMLLKVCFGGIMDSKKKLILGMILVLLVITITGTFAYLEWVKKVGRMVLTIGDISTTEVRISPYLISGSFSPRVTYEGEQYMEVRITNNENKSNKIAVYYEVKNIDSNLRNKYMKYTITKSESLNGTYTEYAEGDFSSVSSGDKLEILNESVPAGVNYYYKVYLWIDGSTGSQNDMIGKNIELETSTEIIKPITAETLAGKANPESLLYADATDEQKKEMWTFSHEATEQVGATTDYRYIGSSPNNYITFNDETWRIIGVFDGRIKIIRQDSLGNMIWDCKQSGVGSSTSTGSNDWSDSQLMYMLNNNWLTTGSDILKSGYTFDGTYVKDGNGKIIYQKGCKPAKADGTTYSCTSNTWSLNDKALTQIDKVTYYLGGASSPTGSGASYYSFERGTTVYTNRPTNWSGYVGLAYPSDYLYTFANGVDETCFNNGNKCSTSNSAVPTSSWMKVMYDLSYYQWLISSDSRYDYFGFYVYSAGDVSSRNTVGNSYGVRPTVYLSSGIKLEGEGTSSNPYQILGD